MLSYISAVKRSLMRPVFDLVVVVGLATLSGCARALNYEDVGPRYAGGPTRATPDPPRCVPETLHVASFNLKLGRQVDRALTLFRSAEPLRGADVIALQEMDAAGTQQFATALGMSYVYYPAAIHPGTGREFGNAILSRWPVVADRKILLPHLGRFRRMRRVAVAATVRLGVTSLRVYSLHLGTGADTGPDGRQDQAQAVLADAEGYDRVVVAGDLNSHGVGKIFEAGGYSWPTRDQPGTTFLFNWDHILVRGLAPVSPAGSGVVRDNLGTSDHRPVWAVVVLAPPVGGC